MYPSRETPLEKVARRASLESNLISYLQAYPDEAGDLVGLILLSKDLAYKQALERAAAMEACLAVSIAKRYNNRDEVLRSMISKLEGKTAINWQGLLP